MNGMAVATRCRGIGCCAGAAINEVFGLEISSSIDQKQNFQNGVKWLDCNQPDVYYLEINQVGLLPGSYTRQIGG
jgi:hypothetical protein